MPQLEDGLTEEQLESREDSFVAPEAGVPGPTVHETETDEESNSRDEDLQRGSNHAVEGGETLAKTLEALNQRITGEATDARLLADPNIRAYLEAKSRGVKMKFVGEDESPPSQTASPTPMVAPDFDSMNNAQLIEYMTKTLSGVVTSVVEKSVGSRFKNFESQVAPKIAQAEAATQTVVRNDLNNQLSSARAKFRDLDQMMPLMTKINKEVSGVTVEELYHLAKVRSGVPLVTQKQLETERPSDLPRNRTPSSTTRRPTSTLGASGFDSLVRNALSEKKNIGRDGF